MEKKYKEDIVSIKKLIQEEEDEAFRILSKKGLLSRLEERLRAEASKKMTISSWTKRPWPAIISLLLITLVFMVALLFILSPSRRENDTETLEAYL